MIKITVRSDASRVVAGIREDAKRFGVAQVQALNRTADQLRTEAGREIRKVYNIKLRAVRAASKIVRARRGETYPRAEVSFTGRPINLAEFDPRVRWVQTRRGKRRAVTVKIKVQGARKTVVGGFVGVHGGADYRGVFKRTSADRYPIRTLRSVSIPRALEVQAITAALMKFADRRYEKNFDDALRNQLRRRNG